MKEPMLGIGRWALLRVLTFRIFSFPLRVAVSPHRPVILRFRCLVLVPALCLLAHAADPFPYAPIATPFPESADQRTLDSATIQVGRVRVNQAGYRPGDRKCFYYVGSGASGFSVVDQTNSEIVATGTLASLGKQVSSQVYTWASNNAQIVPNGDTRYEMTGPEVTGTLYEGVLPELAHGTYVVVVNGDTSVPFTVDPRVYSWVKDAVLKFYGVNRSGDSDSWFHPPSHLKDGPGGDGSLAGGWYDCGDHLKESQTMSYALAILGLGAASLPDRDVDHYGRNHANTVLTDGVPDVLYEARHGAEFVARSHCVASGNVGDMYTSVGNFGQDHNWWGRPEYQDMAPQERGGPVREVRNEVWAPVCGRFAAGMAFVGKLYEPYDQAFATKALSIARDLYAYGKAHQTTGSSAAYNGEGSLYDDMGLAAVALLWATRDTAYKNDLLYNTAIGNKGNATFPKGTFDGGWFAYDNPGPQHGMANTSWASVQSYALWALYKLILRDPEVAVSVGIDDRERLELIEDVAYALIVNIGDAGAGDATIQLPQHSLGWKSSTLTYHSTWKHMYVEREWVWNRYQAGNITELFCYYDIAADIQGMELPNTPASTDWKATEVKNLLVRQLDYMLGVNPWDVSMIVGVGENNFNHIHHRGANPEGKNVPGAMYRYRPPAGALYGAADPSGGLYKDKWNDYYHSETGIDAVTSILLPLMGLSKDDPRDQPPKGTVRIVHVGYDRAVVEIRQSRYGKAGIRYGEAPNEPASWAKSDSAGVLHRIVLEGLKGGTTYRFDAVVRDLYGNRATLTNNGDYFSFTTRPSPQGLAGIANVKVCRVTADSAEIFWFTPNGEYGSTVHYGTSQPPSQTQDGDRAGHPVRFHRVHIGGLEEQTTYYFSVESDGTIDDNGGTYYTFTTPVEQVDFDVRAITYTDAQMQVLGMNLINQDRRSYDSLEIRIYLRGTEEEMKDFGAAVDIGIKYRAAGEQGTHFKGELDPLVQAQEPVRIDDTHRESDNTYAWYLSLPLGSVVMESGSRFRFDVKFRKRNIPYDHNLLFTAPTHRVGDRDWSFSSHSRASGDPVDYGGIPEGSKESLDNNYWNVEPNPYIVVYRKGEFVYGFSPSRGEQVTKRTDYELTAQITSPLHNPSEEYARLGSNTGVVQVQGWATVTEAGVISDIWVNGCPVDDISSVATYNASRDTWDLAMPVPMDSGANVVDITVFGGAGADCEACYGCDYSNHHFFVEFDGPSADTSEPFVPDTTVDTTTPRDTVAQPDTTTRDTSETDTPIPRLRTAWYLDTDADGRVDSLYVQLSDTGSVSCLDELRITWQRKELTLSTDHLIARDSALSADLRALDRDMPLATGGEMTVSFSYRGASRSVVADDSAAPVVVSATFTPGRSNAARRIDTLTVAFSEMLPATLPSDPLLLRKPGGEPLKLRLGELHRNGVTIGFAVLDADPDPAEFPAPHDSVWIDPNVKLRDQAGNAQTNPDNHRALLQVTAAPHAWSVAVAPNPFTPNNAPVADHLPSAPGLTDNGAAIVARSALPIAENAQLTGKVKVFDALADVVCEAAMVEHDGRLYWVWDGCNHYGRTVGTGTYLAVVRVSENGKLVVERRVLVGVDR